MLLGHCQSGSHHLTQTRRSGNRFFGAVVHGSRRTQDVVGRDAALLAGKPITAPGSSHPFKDALPYQGLQDGFPDVAATGGATPVGRRARRWQGGQSGVGNFWAILI
jgi:hypothetical protein